MAIDKRASGEMGNAFSKTTIVSNLIAKEPVKLIILNYEQMILLTLQKLGVVLL